jgi:hypothetical protein
VTRAKGSANGIGIVYAWRCIAHPHLDHCDAAGTGPGSDRAAAKHVRDTGHGTSCVGTPEEDDRG